MCWGKEITADDTVIMITMHCWIYNIKIDNKVAWIIKMVRAVDQSFSIVDRVFPLHTSDPGSMPAILYVLLSIARMIPDHGARSIPWAPLCMT